jgi:enterochelin esterase-like enzyme
MSTRRVAAAAELALFPSLPSRALACIVLVALFVTACDDDGGGPLDADAAADVDAAETTDEASADPDVAADLDALDEPGGDATGDDPLDDPTADDDTNGETEPPALAELRARLDDASPEDYEAVVEAWLEEQPAVPLTEGTRAVFLWRGDEADVRMVGDATGWFAPTSPRLRPLDGYEGVALQFLAQTYETDARLDYKLVIGGSDWRLDPLNPRTMLGGFGANSELAMPAYVTPAEVVTTGVAPQGTLTTHTLESTHLGDTRRFYVYEPAGVGTEGRSLVVFHDGNDYRQIIGAPVILDRVVGSGDVGPLIAVFAPPNDRTPDYNRNDDYVAYLADELVPWLREHYDAGHDAAATGTIGPSMGGLIACYVALTRPDVFGLGGCQSGAFSLDGDAIIALVSESAQVDARLHLVVGTYELAVGGGGDVGNLLEAQRRMVAALSARGYDFVSEEHPQGHSWGLWRDRLPAALRYLYGVDSE